MEGGAHRLLRIAMFVLLWGAYSALRASGLAELTTEPTEYCHG